jgi:hypothetical protein
LPEAEVRLSACTVEDCSNRVYGHGLCQQHWTKKRTYGSVDGPPPKQPKLCSVDGCVAKMYGRGLCARHYGRWKTNGHLELTMPALLAPQGTKWCNSCKSYLPVGEFYISRTLKSGRSAYCRSCSRVAQKRHRVVRADAEARRRVRLAGGLTEVYSRLEIADRDRWICQICRKRIGRKYTWPHPRSFSIDHIVPVSKGGDDVKANVQASHLVCNELKNARGTDQLRLIG